METEPVAQFGAHAPTGLARHLIGICQAQRVGPVGRRIALWLRRVAMWLHGPVFDVTIRGLHLRLHPSDNVGERKFLFMPQFFDPAEMRLLADKLPSDGVFVDIGANVGLYSLNAARYLGVGGRVLAVEPGPEAIRRLRINLSLNTCGTAITHVDCAIGDQDGTLMLRLDSSNLGGSSLVHDRGGAATPVRVRPLLDVLAEAGINRIDILKIDVEGAEDKALIPFFTAAPATLHPSWLIIERSEDSWAGDLLAVLAAQGYRPLGDSKMNWLFTKAAT